MRMARFYDWTFKQTKRPQRGQGSRIMNDNERERETQRERERELYVRARDATKEAQRQGDRQLRAAMEASILRPGGSSIPLCSFPLKFNIPSLEEAYWRKCSTNSDKDYVPVACLILFCVLVPTAMFSRRWNETVLQSVNLWGSGNLLWYMFAVILCCAVLVIQLGFPKWYQSNRGRALLCIASVLWIWGSVKLFLISNTELRFSLPIVLIQCIFISILYRIPFCIHIYSNAVGLGLQIVAILARGSLNEAPILLLLLFVGHAVGILIAYVLDRECRSNFLHSMPQPILEDITGSENGHQEQFFQSCETSLLRQMPNLGQISSRFLNPKALEKQGFDEAISQKVIQTNAPRRALGGFAGGFGGVSGLKSRKPPFMTNATSSANTFSGKNGDSNTSFTDSWAYSLGAVGSFNADNIVEGRLSTSVSSCSCVDSHEALDNQFYTRAG